MRVREWKLWRLWFVAAGLAAGCGESADRLETVPVSGVVTLDQRPLVNATVTFIPTDRSGKAISASGTTDESGVYTLSAATYVGIVPGSYKVLIEHYTMADGSPLKVDEALGGIEQMKLMGQLKQTLGPVYSALEQTTLTAQVLADQEEGYDFNVVAQP